MKSKNILIVSAFILVILGGFYFLNSNSSANQNQGTSESNVIKVGMSGSYKPYTYLDD